MRGEAMKQGPETYKSILKDAEALYDGDGIENIPAGSQKDPEALLEKIPDRDAESVGMLNRKFEQAGISSPIRYVTTISVEAIQAGNYDVWNTTMTPSTEFSAQDTTGDPQVINVDLRRPSVESGVRVENPRKTSQGR